MGETDEYLISFLRAQFGPLFQRIECRLFPPATVTDHFSPAISRGFACFLNFSWRLIAVNLYPILPVFSQLVFTKHRKALAGNKVVLFQYQVALTF